MSIVKLQLIPHKETKHYLVLKASSRNKRFWNGVDLQIKQNPLILSFVFSLQTLAWLVARIWLSKSPLAVAACLSGWNIWSTRASRYDSAPSELGSDVGVRENSIHFVLAHALNAVWLFLFFICWVISHDSVKVMWAKWEWGLSRNFCGESLKHLVFAAFSTLSLFCNCHIQSFIRLNFFHIFLSKKQALNDWIAASFRHLDSLIWHSNYKNEVTLNKVFFLKAPPHNIRCNEYFKMALFNKKLNEMPVCGKALCWAIFCNWQF